VHQLLDPIDGRVVQTSQRTNLDIKPPSLDAVKQFLALQTQFFCQLVDACGQRQLLLGGGLGRFFGRDDPIDQG
jgi:hypothetical protein